MKDFRRFLPDISPTGLLSMPEGITKLPKPRGFPPKVGPFKGDFISQIKEQLADEEAAFKTYLGMAAEAERNGKAEVARQLRTIAYQEGNHGGMLRALLGNYK